jgi:hypothetical protein
MREKTKLKINGPPLKIRNCFYFCPTKKLEIGRTRQFFFAEESESAAPAEACAVLHGLTRFARQLVSRFE